MATLVGLRRCIFSIGSTMRWIKTCQTRFTSARRSICSSGTPEAPVSWFLCFSVSKCGSCGRSDISHDAAKFLAHLVTKLVWSVKSIARGRKPTPGVQAVAAVHQCSCDVALLKCKYSLLSTVFYVALHFDYHIQTATGDDNLHSAMQAWRKQLKHDSSSSDFAWEVYNFVVQKGARLAGDDGLSFTDHLESAVHIQGVQGLAAPFTMPEQIAKVGCHLPLCRCLWSV